MIFKINYAPTTFLRGSAGADGAVLLPTFELKPRTICDKRKTVLILLKRFIYLLLNFRNYVSKAKSGALDESACFGVAYE